MNQSNHKWHFFRAGGFDQVKLTCGADIANLRHLDQKLWVALACPTQGLEFDAKTLQLIDTDHDGRIRVPEIIAACEWACACLKNPDDLLKGADALPLSAINDATPAGRQILASARQILANLGKPDATEITVADTDDTSRIFAQTRFNGDGVIVPDSAGEDRAMRQLIEEIMACCGSEPDRSGQPGINQAKVDAFFAEARAFVEWHQKADATVLPLGEATASAAAAVQAVKAKVDDYFARCRLAAFDPRAVNILNPPETEYAAAIAKNPNLTGAELAAFPLARIEPGKPLPLTHGINPGWESAIQTLRTAAVRPLLGDKTALTEADWVALQSKLAPYQSWLAAKSGAAVEKLGLNRVREILAGNAYETLCNLIAQDKALEPQANAIASVEKLVRLHRDLATLLHNFVNFRDFYGRIRPAIFQAGTLYLDQRSCTLTLPVEDPAKHATLAGLAGAYLAYCDCVRKATGEKRQIVAAFTNGDSDNLMVGRNGIFYDRQGRDWDATITKIIDNPISLRQAFWAPYKKVVRIIEEFIAKRAAAAEAKAETQVATTVTSTIAGEKPAKPPELKKVDVGTVAALGVAFGALGTAGAYFLGLFKGLALWQIPLIIIGIMLLISLPSVVLAYIKLRKRNLGPLLDANGWAINAKAKINVPFGAALTGVAKLPPGAHRDLVDPYAESHLKRNLIIALIVLIAVLWGVWRAGWLDTWLPAKLQQRPAPPAETVPAAEPAPAPPPA